MSCESNFAEALKDHLESSPKLTKRGQKILDIIYSPPSDRRTRRLHAMENHARGAMGRDPTEGIIDWLKDIDWSYWGPIILKTILAVIAIIIML